MGKSLRTYLDQLKKERPQDLKVINREVDPIHEVSGLAGSFNRYAKGEGDRQFWLECYSGGAYTVDRVGRGTTRVADLFAASTT